MESSKIIRLHPLDNILVATQTLEAGEAVQWEGNLLYFENSIGIGHKLAADFIGTRELIIKYGVPISSATEDIPVGAHVHLHNMKSDYLPTYTIETGFEKE